jgi:two-component system, OmpR family, heavy metal sensor histidine kinase CusS
MIPKSFRTRILLLSVAVSGLVLLGFAWWSWELLEVFAGLRGLDAELATGHAYSEKHLDVVRWLRGEFLLVLAAGLACVLGGSWLLAWYAVRPVDLLIDAAETITAQDLERRIPKRSEGDEFGRLIDVFNDMLERLERSFNHATRFSADAAHELKTPLTILQGQLDQALQEAPDGSPLQQNLGRLLDEVQRLKVIIRRLLLLSLADAGRIRVALMPMRLDELLGQVIEDVEILAPELGVIQELEKDAWVDADEALLQQAIQNLVNNGIKYNIDGGKIRFQLFRHEKTLRFAIANTSEGIPEEERRQVFRRFYRADPAHSRKIDGVGLGLSLAREIVRAHHGKLWLADAPEGWVMFVMELPERAGDGVVEGQT